MERINQVNAYYYKLKDHQDVGNAIEMLGSLLFEHRYKYDPFAEEDYSSFTDHRIMTNVITAIFEDMLHLKASKAEDLTETDIHPHCTFLHDTFSSEVIDQIQWPGDELSKISNAFLCDPSVDDDAHVAVLEIFLKIYSLLKKNEHQFAELIRCFLIEQCPILCRMLIDAEIKQNTDKMHRRVNLYAKIKWLLELTESLLNSSGKLYLEIRKCLQHMFQEAMDKKIDDFYDELFSFVKRDELVDLEGLNQVYEKKAVTFPREVWNDLRLCGFSQANIWSHIDRHKAPDGEYAIILETFLRGMAQESEFKAVTVATHLFKQLKSRWIATFPKAEFRRQIICDGEWRQHFLSQDGWDVLLKIASRMQTWQRTVRLDFTFFKDMLENICISAACPAPQLHNVHTTSDNNERVKLEIGDRVHIGGNEKGFIRYIKEGEDGEQIYAIALDTRSFRGEQYHCDESDEYGRYVTFVRRGEIVGIITDIRSSIEELESQGMCGYHMGISMKMKSNVLIHSICINARVKRTKFLDVIPRRLVAEHSNVLVIGYLRINGYAKSIPKDVINFILWFF